MPAASRDTPAENSRPPLQSPARRFGFSLALLAMAALLCILAAETLLRVHFGDVARITGATEWEDARWKGLTYSWDVYHPRFGWTNQPDYRSDSRVPFQLSINSRGLRGEREYASHPPAGVRRIALFGDSLAFGEEVDDDETVSFFLERDLADSEVLNFGVHGYGLGQMMLRLEDEGFAFHPDHVVVMLMLPRDLERDLAQHFVHNKPAFRAHVGALRIANLPVPEASQQPWLLRRSFAAAFLFGRAAPWVAEREVGAQIEVLRLLLERIRERAAAHGVPWTLVTVTNSLDVRRLRDAPDERAVLDALQRAIAALDIDVLDLIDFLEQRWRAEGRALSTPNWHWSRRGNCLIAEQIVQHLQSGSFKSPRHPADSSRRRVQCSTSPATG